MREVIHVLPAALQRVPIPIEIQSVKFDSLLSLAMEEAASVRYGAFDELNKRKNLESFLFREITPTVNNPRTLQILAMHARGIITVLATIIKKSLEENRMLWGIEYPYHIRKLKTYKQTRLVFVVMLEL